MREDLGPDAPEWVTGLITPLNSFMSSVYYALDSDLTFTENVASAVKKVSFTTRSDYTSASPVIDGWEERQIYNPLKTKPIGVHLVSITDTTGYKAITSAVFVHWTFLDGYIKLRYITGLANSNKYEINVLIF